MKFFTSLSIARITSTNVLIIYRRPPYKSTGPFWTNDKLAQVHHDKTALFAAGKRKPAKISPTLFMGAAAVHFLATHIWGQNTTTKTGRIFMCGHADLALYRIHKTNVNYPGGFNPLFSPNMGWRNCLWLTCPITLYMYKSWSIFVSSARRHTWYCGLVREWEWTWQKHDDIRF